MARDQEPLTESQIEALREEMEDQRQEIREAMAADLGGDPEDYLNGQWRTDGGD